MKNCSILKKYLEENKKYFEENLEKELDTLNSHKELVEGMKYATLNGGKRLRPILLFLTLEMLGIQKERGLNSAMALELIHSYSLVHDDLPAMDNDDFRRGMPTVHKKFGEAKAILIGDALLTHAFYLLTKRNLNVLKPEQIVDIVSEFSIKSGAYGMVAGQYMDIESEGKDVDIERMNKLHFLKTGQLLILPIKTATIIAELDREKSEKLIEFATKFGIAYQIKDDILDVEGSFKELGKRVNKDDKLQKMTFVRAFGLDGAKKLLNASLKECNNILTNNFQNYDLNLFYELIDYMELRKS